VSSLISLAQVESHAVGMFLIQDLNKVEGTLAQRLANGVKEDKDEIS
jgi:hypothetical protein